ncbi:NADase-type glycan-binding domain-containing protein [Geodermatophilus sp. SYSU D01180]
MLGVATAGVLAVGGYLVVDRTGSGGSGTEASEESATFGAPGSTASTSAAPLDAADGDPSPPGERSDEPQPTSPPGPLQPVAVAATCQAAPGIDAAGDPVTYEPALTLDGVPATAWRCPGSAVGARLTFDFGHEVSLASVGLVPGYAKVDPADGTNRFTENRTVTAVTWSFDDGTSFVQRIDAPRASLAVSDLPAPVSSTRVVLQVTGTGNDTALRDFTAISDVAFSGQD